MKVISSIYFSIYRNRCCLFLFDYAGYLQKIQTEKLQDFHKTWNWVAQEPNTSTHPNWSQQCIRREEQPWSNSAK